MKRGLNLGSGPIYLDSDFFIRWENSDFADSESAKGWKLDKRRDFTKPMNDIKDGSVDYIVAWHILEHMGFPTERDDVIREWYRVLRPGGRIFLACPDLKKIARHIVDGDEAWGDWFICMVNVYGPYNGFRGDIHRWGYNQEEIIKLFTKDHAFADCLELLPGMLSLCIGEKNALKLGFANYNAQMEIRK